MEALFNHLFNSLIMLHIGTVALMPRVPSKFFLPCDGRKVTISDYTPLYSSLSSQVQADGTYFWLPKLPDKFGFCHVICYYGLYSVGLKYTVDFTDKDVPVGTLVPFDGENIPNGWILSDGLEYEFGDFKRKYPDSSKLINILKTYRKASNPSASFIQIPDTGKERYILCMNGNFLL